MFEGGKSEKIKAEPTEGRAEPTEGRAEGRAEQRTASAEWCGSLHLFSIGNYFHRSLSPASNINPKIII